MTSTELNEKIAALCDDDTLYEAFGGKSIPYVGWFWRPVNFDAPDYAFGVMPTSDNPWDPNDTTQLGFMQNNKWGYDRHRCPPADWQEIRRLLERAVEEPSRETLEAVNRKIQSLHREERHIS